jgi:lipopolysaccharide transport system ATP-binding protein
MSNEAVIRVEGLGKKYVIGHETQRAGEGMLRDAIVRMGKNFARTLKETASGRALVAGDTTEEFWALKEVSFEVKRGEVFGIIGRNGAGKSTLLKVLSRITEPTKGRVVIKGRVASLLEVGTGFHPELSGRENIFLNGAILGMSQKEIRAKFDEIVDFAEVERFVDTPVKRFSSGMYVRLAFAVAAYLEPEILIVDEVLAVGDAEFQRKCLGKMKDIAGGDGRTVLFVSHNMPSVQQLCSSGMLLSEGAIVFRGSIDDTIAVYMNELEQVSRQPLRTRRDRHGDGKLRLVDITLHNSEGTPIAAAICGEALRLRIHYESKFHGSDQNVDVAFNLRNSAGVLLTCFGNIQAGQNKLPLHPEGYFECIWPRVNLRSGAYLSTIFVAVGGNTSDWLQNAFQLQIEDGNFFGTGNLLPRDHGDLVFDHSWSSVQVNNPSR